MNFQRLSLSDHLPDVPIWVQPFITELRKGDPQWEKLHERLTTVNHWLDPELWLTIIGTSLLILIIRLFLSNYILIPIARKTNLLREDRPKFVEAVINTVYYAIAWALNTFVCYRHGLFNDNYTFWYIAPTLPIAQDKELVYVMSIAWYVHGVFAHIFLDTKKSDFWLMLIHHFVTISLMVFSFKFFYVEIGLLVLFSMDICDVVLNACKVYRYYANIHPSIAKFEVPIFALVPITWLCFRVLYYPYSVIHSASIQTISMMSWKYMNGWYFFNIQLYLLFVFNLFWLFMIAKISFRVLLNGASPDDIREPSKQKAAAAAAAASAASAASTPAPSAVSTANNSPSVTATSGTRSNRS